MAILLENITWTEAREHLNKDSIACFALGAGSKEHGPHLKLDNDFQIAEHLKKEIVSATNDGIIMGPTINFGYYPAFIEYPGSISLSKETSAQMIIEICKSIANFGPKKFYIINTGVSTLTPLKMASEALGKEGLNLKFTDLLQAFAPIEKKICTQEGGTHADEAETSIMLYIAPERVDMSKAVKDFSPWGTGGMTPYADKNSSKTYSPTGIWGDPTLASKEKGEILISELIKVVLSDINNF